MTVGNLGPSIIGANRFAIHINHPSRWVKGQGKRAGGQGMGLRRVPMGAMGGSAVHGHPLRRHALGPPIEGLSILLQGFGLTRSGGLQLPWSKLVLWARTAISPSTMTSVVSMTMTMMVILATRTPTPRTTATTTTTRETSSSKITGFLRAILSPMPSFTTVMADILRFVTQRGTTMPLAQTKLLDKSIELGSGVVPRRSNLGVLCVGGWWLVAKCHHQQLRGTYL